MKKHYIAHVAVLIVADNDEEAAAVVSETLSNPHNEEIVDWQYSEDDFLNVLRKPLEIELPDKYELHHMQGLFKLERAKRMIRELKNNINQKNL